MSDAFKALGGASMGWADPAATGTPPEEIDFDRCADPGKYRILTLRAQAWARALRDLDLAEFERIADDPAHWQRLPWFGLSDRIVRVAPRREGAIPLLFAYNTLEDVPDAQVGVGAGKPGVLISNFPEAHFDAYDTGSAELLDEFDDAVLSVVTGRFVSVATDTFLTQETLRGSYVVEGEISGFSAAALADLFAEARGGRSPHEIVYGFRWW